METLKNLKSLALDTLKETAASCSRENDLIDLTTEVADGCVPVYYSDLYEVFADSPDAIDAALDEYINETVGGEDLGNRVKDGGLSNLIALGIYWHLEQYLQGQVAKILGRKGKRRGG